DLAIGRGFLWTGLRIGEVLDDDAAGRVERLLVNGRELAAASPAGAEAAHDGVEPGGDRGGAPKITDRSRHGHEAFLRDVAGVVLVAAHPEAEAVEVWLIADEQRLERGWIAGARAGQQLVVGAGNSGSPLEAVGGHGEILHQKDVAWVHRSRPRL